MTALNNAGDQAAWAQTDGIVTGKMWLAAFRNSRDAHIEAHGQTVRIGEMYTVGGEKLHLAEGSHSSG